MADTIKLRSDDNHSVVTIYKGELISYQLKGVEVMHQKGDPGWGSTEIEMFPIIGATAANDFSVQTAKGEAKLDQHGILRGMEYLPMQEERSKASFYKTYKANTEVKNPKFPEKSTQQYMHWPYDFQFTKIFDLTNGSLTIYFEIKSEDGMPFMLGFHPAFKIYSKNPILRTGNTLVSLDEVLEVGSSAFLLEECKELVLENNDSLIVNLKTKGFRHMMLWSEVSNMVCIEPITFYPSSVSIPQLHKGFDYSSEYEKYQVTISPLIL
ncbi:aldose 1-epimerase [Aquimarina algiphila]|uniref:aldose epimerase family protein n=1 Tax=Aquimarina algiphila TaxID=2047982 RepID=UPI002491AE7E|nr:aldose 1-epimerase [Aquimarina algiphila]